MLNTVFDLVRGNTTVFFFPLLSHGNVVKRVSRTGLASALVQGGC